MAQASDPGSSFADRTDLVAMAGGSLEGLVQRRYLDVPRAARRGHAGASLVATALARLVRSPQGADREPGIPMPSYDRFVQDVVPLVSTTRRESGDLVTRMQADRSVLVSIAAATDTLGGMKV